jgi:hypothetical protein
MREIKTEFFHFLFCLIRGPALLSHTIRSDHHSGAVITDPAVHENFFPGIGAQQGKKLRESFIVGSRAVPRHRDVFHAQAGDQLAFTLPVASQVHDDIDSHFSERSEALSRGLATAIQGRCRMAKVWQIVTTGF